jgi:uncharacterized protein YbjT (DUF2867 family)
MILLTGVTGTIGRAAMLRIPPGTPLRLLARDPSLVRDAPPASEVFPATYSDGESLLAALRGIRVAFLVTTRIDGADDEAFVRAARRAGVGRVVKLSAAAVEDPDADDAITRWQRGCEALLRSSGLGWTFLRPRAFMSNTLSWASSIRAEGVVRALYGSSGNAVVDPRDVADAVVRTLLEPDHAGRSYTLTGPEPISAEQQTAVLATALGKPLRFEELTPAQALAALRRRYPEDIADALVRSAARQRDGAKGRVTDTVERLTGRAPGDFRGWAGDHLDAFTRSR